jgi:hypothetical protein
MQLLFFGTVLSELDNSMSVMTELLSSCPHETVWLFLDSVISGEVRCYSFPQY